MNETYKIYWVDQVIGEHGQSPENYTTYRKALEAVDYMYVNHPTRIMQIYKVRGSSAPVVSPAEWGELPY